MTLIIMSPRNNTLLLIKRFSGWPCGRQQELDPRAIEPWRTKEEATKEFSNSIIQDEAVYWVANSFN